MRLTRRAVLGSLSATLGPLPARAASLTGDGFRRIEAGKATLRLQPAPAPETAVLAYDGAVPGPLLRAKHGEEVKVRLLNGLDAPTTLSWHGVRIDNAMDGVAGLTQKPVLPGESFDYRFRPPDSGLAWYHPNVAPDTAAQVGAGLYGVLIVDEPEPPPVDRDVLVVLADAPFGDAVHTSAGARAAAEAPTIGLPMLNGRPPPQEDIFAPGARLRLRIVSAAATRILLVGFEAARPHVLAIDGQPCEMFEPARCTLPVTPGARFDVMLDLPSEAGAAARLVLRRPDAPDATLMTFRTDGARRSERPPIAGLPANPLLPTAIHLERAKRLDLTIGAGPPEPGDHPRVWTLNGVAADGLGPTPLFSVKRGAPVTLGFVNKTQTVQQMHVHGHHMRLLHDLDDGWDPYWRDSVLVPPGRRKHAAFVADNPGKWRIEGLFAGLATWFEVI